MYHCIKSVRIWGYFGRHFLAFGVNTERYGVSLHIQSKYRKMQTRIALEYGHFSCSVCIYKIHVHMMYVLPCSS